ncbi:malonate decarboxylase holo-ACP synthase [Massilia sp. LXY-6]|uniref:malonate decarboxylase holo-ACP synthase n=1 Tax=Massilia sp. LXY-6 TaxID=3379823 RepID=UPI003EDF6C87
MDIAVPLPRPHDLLFLRRPEAFETCGGGERPGWLDAAWLARAPLVVRRSASGAARVPVGVRGLQRGQRCAGHIAVAEVARRVTPEMLAQAVLGDFPALRDAAAALPCVAALLELSPRLQELGLAWGPAGGTGFWLACGLPVLRPGSDLDLLVRAPQPLAPALLSALCALQSHAGCRVDIQVDTGAGGFALMEHARGGKVMLKTAGGPLLVADPWLAKEAA